MKIVGLKIRNYRTLEQVDVDFPSSYTAICGRNDSGKTNIVRAIRALMKEEETDFPISFEREQELSLKDDFPKWKDTPANEREIRLTIRFLVSQEKDTGFFQFLARQLSLKEPGEELELEVTVVHGSERAEPNVAVLCLGETYSGLDAQEVLKRIQTSRSILFHNSTQASPAFPFRSPTSGVLGTKSIEHESTIASMKKAVNTGINKISKTHQKEVEKLLGRLDAKYHVGISIPSFDFSSIPFGITLGYKKFEVPLDDWGSGTRNRTLILLTLFRAKQLSESEASAAKVTPIIVIEEPESFLHPAAQAEFGRVLHDLAEEFQVQVIITTHSPYLLNIDDAESNVLLERQQRYKQFRETIRVNTSEENWAEPFCLALGLSSQELKPWRDLMLAPTESILLVEGETDKEYFEMLRQPEHEENQLSFEGEIVSYGGTGALSNSVLLRFIKNRYKKMFVTFDLDSEKIVVKSLQALDISKKNYSSVGVDMPGKRNIEGLLPDAVRSAVYSENAELVQAATQGSPDEQKSAKNELKKLFLARFKEEATPGTEYFGEFYSLVRIINKAF